MTFSVSSFDLVWGRYKSTCSYCEAMPQCLQASPCRDAFDKADGAGVGVDVALMLASLSSMRATMGCRLIQLAP